MRGQPNIVFVLTDDQGYGDLGCHGNPVLQTPNIDRFHKESLRFTNFHVGPTCAPTRSGLYTGHHANSTGVWHTVGGRSLLRGNETCIADVFAENGYRTALFGKWHLGDNAPYRPQDRGFQHVVCHGGGGISQTQDYWGNDYFDDHYYVNGKPRPFKGYCTDVFFNEALKYIAANTGNPFMCFITTNAPHSPFNVEREYSNRYQNLVQTPERANFYGMITNIDENFGKLERKLTELGIADDTILIFMTDNGSAMHDKEAHTCGLRGSKGSEFDGGHRVPFFLRWANGKLLAPLDLDTLTAHVDFMPTLMDLCGIAPQRYEHCHFHGRSLKPLLTDPSPDWPERVLVTDSQRLPNPVKWRQSAVMTQRWRLLNGRQLYDINADRGQTNDIAAQHPEVVTQLRTAYNQWWALVSKQVKEDIPISIGLPAEPITRLCAHDWRHPDDPWPEDPQTPENNDYLVYDQAHIRKGSGKNGYFEIHVETPGLYRFELCRWPHEEQRPLRAGIPESDEGWRSDVILKRYRPTYSGGVELPVTRAGITIAGQERETEIQPDDHAVTFKLDLPSGPTHLTTWFRGDHGFERGAYYVYVSRSDD